MNIGRILSALTAIAYLAAAFSLSSPQTGLRVMVFLLLPMVCIWYSEEMGEYTGYWGRSYIDEKSPGCMIALVGWSLLLLPVIIVLITHLMSGR